MPKGIIPEEVIPKVGILKDLIAKGISEGKIPKRKISEVENSKSKISQVRIPKIPEFQKVVPYLNSYYSSQSI